MEDKKQMFKRLEGNGISGRGEVVNIVWAVEICPSVECGENDEPCSCFIAPAPEDINGACEHFCGTIKDEAGEWVVLCGHPNKL